MWCELVFRFYFFVLFYFPFFERQDVTWWGCYLCVTAYDSTGDSCSSSIRYNCDGRLWFAYSWTTRGHGYRYSCLLCAAAVPCSLGHSWCLSSRVLAPLYLCLLGVVSVEPGCQRHCKTASHRYNYTWPSLYLFMQLFTHGAVQLWQVLEFTRSNSITCWYLVVLAHRTIGIHTGL